MTEPWDSFSIALVHERDQSETVGYGPAERGEPLLTISPLTDIVELSEGFCLYCNLPGVAPENVMAIMDGEFLHIRAESLLPPIKGKVHALEFSDILYEGKIRLPSFDTEKLDASFVNGLLRIFMPFPPQSPPVRIPVNLE